MISIAFISQILSFLVVVALSFGVLVVLASLIRFNLMTHSTKSLDPATADPAQLFELQVIKALGGFRKNPPPFFVMRILPVPTAGAPVVEFNAEGIPLWQEALRKCLRDNDVVQPMADGSVQVVARFDPVHTERVATRVLEKIAKASIPLPSGDVVKWGACMGLARFPENGGRASLLIESARQAAETARQSGANAYHSALTGTSDSEESAATMPPDVARKILDEVTGVLRQDRLGTALQKFVALRRKEELGVSVAYFSVDDYAIYRERYGQDAAHHILKTVADLLSSHSRETDLLARAHEADFIVAMDCAPKMALVGAQRLVNSIKKVTIRHGRMSLRVSLSAGVAGYPDHTGRAREMFHAAGHAMLQARNGGRTVVAMYEPEEQQADHQRPRSAAEF